MNKVLILGMLLPILGSCQTPIAPDPLPCPPRPLLTPITPEEQRQINPDVLEKIASNQIELKAYSRKLEARAGCEAP